MKRVLQISVSPYTFYSIGHTEGAFGGRKYYQCKQILLAVNTLKAGEAVGCTKSQSAVLKV